jgi:hypothetical protein
MITKYDYKDKLKIEIVLEKMHLEAAIAAYSQNQVKFERISVENSEDLFRIEMKGIAECRPSITFGDRIHAMNRDAETCQIYIGFVKKIEAESIIVLFDKDFEVDNTRYDIEFHISEAHFMNQIIAIDAIEDTIGEPSIFPDVEQGKYKIPKIIVDASINENNELFVNEQQVAWNKGQFLNPAQKKAIVNGLRYESRPHPMIIQGPPGKNYAKSNYR